MISFSSKESLPIVTGMSGERNNSAWDKEKLAIMKMVPKRRWDATLFILNLANMALPPSVY